MKRLIKTSSRPRENRKSVQYLLSLQLDVDNSCGDAINKLELFKKWVTTCFTHWDESILQYYLYNYNLLQDSEEDKYFLDFRIESILKDDTITTGIPNMDENLKKQLKKEDDGSYTEKEKDSGDDNEETN